MQSRKDLINEYCDKLVKLQAVLLSDYHHDTQDKSTKEKAFHFKFATLGNFTNYSWDLIAEYYELISQVEGDNPSGNITVELRDCRRKQSNELALKFHGLTGSSDKIDLLLTNDEFAQHPKDDQRVYYCIVVGSLY